MISGATNYRADHPWAGSTGGLGSFVWTVMKLPVSLSNIIISAVSRNTSGTFPHWIPLLPDEAFRSASADVA